MSATNPVSPKVISSTVTVAVTTLVMYLLGQIDAISAMPDTVQAALLVVVTAGVTYVAGYATTDPRRQVG